MKLLQTALAVLTAPTLAAPGAASTEWRPHEFDDVQQLIAEEAQSLRGGSSAPASSASQAKLSLAARHPPAVRLAKHVSKIERQLANPALGDYLGTQRPAGTEFSTQWATKRSPKSFAWHPMDDLEDVKAKKVSRGPQPAAAPLVPYSKLLSDDMKDAVLVAESLRAETGGAKGQTKALRAATAWGPRAPQPEKRAVLAEKAAATVGHENPYTTMLGLKQDVTVAAKVNPYEAYLASDMDHFYSQVHREEARAERAESVDKNGYMKSVVPEDTYLSWAGH